MRYCPECRSVNPDIASECVVCGDRLPEPGALKLVDGRYRPLRRIGRGAMGVVWKAEDVALRRHVALKFLSARAMERPQALRRFQREAAALASIHSSHVAQIYAFGVEEVSYFFAMELVIGQGCDKIIDLYAENDTFMPARRALVILKEMAMGLSAVHAAGLVHRDVKPDNAVVELGTGRTVLVDFGLAAASKRDRTSGAIGTPGYMSPEQIRSERVGPRSDVYGLGCTAFHLLTNELAFPRGNVAEMMKAHCNDRPRRVSSIRPELGPLDEVIQKALEKRPEDRFASAAELISALTLAERPWLTPGDASHGIDSSYEVSVEEPLPVAARILVVDDDDDFAKLAVRAAQLAFFGTQAKVARARSGEEAIANAAQKPPQLVLLDYQMPGIDGVETLSRLRTMPQTRDARVIVITANPSEEQRWRFDAFGIDGFLEKPIILRELVEVIGALGRARGWIPLDESELDIDGD